MKHIHIIKLLLISSLLVSCRNNNVKEILTGDRYRYWYNESDTILNLPLYFIFNKDGQLQVKSQDERGRLQDFVFSHDVEWDHRWSIKNDTLLYMGLYDNYFVISRYNDSMVILTQNNQNIVLHAIRDPRMFIQNIHAKRKNIIDSIQCINYDIRIDRICPNGNNYILKDISSSVEISKADMNIIAPQRGDRLVKEKNYVLLNRITNDSIYLYRYTVSGEHPILSILQSGEKKNFIQRNGIYQR